MDDVHRNDAPFWRIHVVVYAIGRNRMKAILVIDLPKNCAECKLMFLQGIGEGICNAVDWEERPSWCPLKPLPDCPDVPDTIANDVAYIIGWNDCIVEISKERKEAKSLIKNEEESVSNRGER